VLVRVLAALGLLGGLAETVQGAAPPAQFTPEQAKRWERRNRLLDRANAVLREGQVDEAIASVRRALALERGVRGDLSGNGLGWLDWLARTQQEQGQFAEGIESRRERLTLLRQRHGQDDWRVKDARLDLEDIQLRARLPAEQRRRLRQAERWNERVFRLWGDGRSKEALGPARKALAVRREVLGEWHRLTALGWFNLAAQYAALHRGGPALLCGRQALAVTRKVLGEKHPDYARSLNSLAKLFFDLGDSRTALPLFQNALAVNREALGEEHPDYAASLSGLGLLYRNVGDTQAAMPLLGQALRVYKEALGEKHPDSLSSLNNLAALHKERGDHQAALPLLRLALRLRKEVQGESHPDYANSLHNLASLYQDMGEHQKALPLFRKALALTREARGEFHPEYALTLNHLALLYQAMGQHSKALPLFQKALAINKEALGERHPHYALGLNNLSLLAWERGDARQSAALSGRALEAWRRHLDDNLAALSHRQRLQRLDDLAWTLDFHLSSSLADGAKGDLYEAALVYKGLSTSRAAEDRLAARNLSAAPLLEELRRARARLAAQAARPPADGTQLAAWRKRFDALEASKEDLEVKLARASDGFRRLRQRPTSGAVSSALPRGAALVEILAYDHRTPPTRKGGKGTSQRRLLAWVLREGRPAALVQLGPGAPVEQAVRLWRKTALGPSDRPSEEAAALLREKVWLPVSKRLGAARLVLFCPDGELSGLPFAALPGDKAGTFLLEEYTFARLTSGRQLLLGSPAHPDARGLLALGPLDFGKRPPGKGARFWPPLPGAALEARQVAGLFAKAFRGEPATLLEGSRAAKPRLLAELDERPAWLHLATHGYFDPPPATLLARQGDAPGSPLRREVARTFARNPLLVSGLVLAGGNEDAEAGRLTAEEVAGLDLSGVRLAVLSACQTAQGREAGWQGVQGLQRAFHEAGAKTLLASLWSVSDAATSVLMEEFYTQLWGKNLPPMQALRRAQLFVLNHPERVGRRARELRELLAKRGVAEGALAARGLGKRAGMLPAGAAKARGRSPVAWWAPWVLSGDWR
jgi:CHAT domain-containing protein/tetratricopeptide (TPR) repeat protein